MRKQNKWLVVLALGAALITVAVFRSSKPTPVQSQSLTTSAVTLDGRYTYVANLNGHSVSVIDNSTGGAVTSIPVGRGPNSVTMSADGRTVLVRCSRSRTVCVIEIATQRLVQTLPIR